MSDFLIGAYPWFKSAHIVAVVSWMAALLYLPRLLVYHANAKPASEMSETFKLMEANIHRLIMTPAMLLVWGFGLMLMITPGTIDWSSPWWFLVKLVCVVLLTVFHLQCGKWRKAFRLDSNQRSAKFFRVVNEIPTVLLIIIVILVVVRPF